MQASFRHHVRGKLWAKSGDDVQVVDNAEIRLIQTTIGSPVFASFLTLPLLSGNARVAYRTSPDHMIITTTSRVIASGWSDLTGRLVLVMDIIRVILEFRPAASRVQADADLHDQTTN